MKKDFYINGIQQVGIGNNDVYATYQWYKDNLYMDVQVFDEKAEAALMLPYTGGIPRERHAILALNLQGGGGVEIWQYTSRKAQGPEETVVWGDYGISATQYKVRHIEKAREQYSASEVSVIYENVAGQKHFYLRDADGNIIDIVEYQDWFQEKKLHGGVCGAVIAVSDIDKSLAFYQDILAYDIVLGDQTKSFDAYNFLENNHEESPVFRSVILTHSDTKNGAFSELLGKTQIELIERIDFQGKPIFKDRMWGDLGYIHLCFDVGNMDSLRAYCLAKNHPFQVDSGDFDMGDAGGYFAYIEDPDGTLIEFVETHKVPIIKKINWFLNLKKRKKQKPLPRWMIKAMGI